MPAQLPQLHAQTPLADCANKVRLVSVPLRSNVMNYWHPFSLIHYLLEGKLFHHYAHHSRCVSEDYLFSMTYIVACS